VPSPAQPARNGNLYMKQGTPDEQLFELQLEGEAKRRQTTEI
jgi:hypothetical protein